MTPSPSALPPGCALLATLTLSWDGATARAFTGPCDPGIPIAGEDLQITIFPHLTRSAASDPGNAAFALHELNAAQVMHGHRLNSSLSACGVHVSDSSTVPRGLDDSWQKSNSPIPSTSFAGAKPNPDRAFTQFYRNEFQTEFIGGKPCGQLHIN